MKWLGFEGFAWGLAQKWFPPSPALLYWPSRHAVALFIRLFCANQNWELLSAARTRQFGEFFCGFRALTPRAPIASRAGPCALQNLLARKTCGWFHRNILGGIQAVKYILRVEGVDFDATIGDTHNLSAFRGGSLALLAAPKGVRAFLTNEKIAFTELFAGASIGAWSIDLPANEDPEKFGPRIRDWLRLGDWLGSEAANWPHLSFVVDLAAIDAAKGVGADYLAYKKAEAKNRARQFRAANWALPEFEEKARGAHDRFDRVRPALPDCRVDAQGLVDQAVSRSFRARFEFGRRQRQEFYASNASARKADGLDFAESFEDIVADEPDDLPNPLSQKLAVFYADGNKFNKIREKANTVDALSEFSRTLIEYQRRQLLDGLLDWLRAGVMSEQWGAYVQYPRERKRDEKAWPLRFETLMWGGDELTFVMPSWLGVEFARKFFDEWTKDWKAPSRAPLTFGAGLVFCNYKTPIRQARKMAKIMAEEAKGAIGSAEIEKQTHVLQIEAFESISMPEWGEGAGLARYRENLFNAKPEPGHLTLRGEEIGKTFERVSGLKTDFPRSQLYRLLRKARDDGAFALGEAGDEALKTEAEVYFRRKGLDAAECLPKLKILSEAPLAYSLFMGAALWDYVDPLETA